MHNLKSHLLERLRELASLPELPNPTQTDIASVGILDDGLFTHKVMRINYDSYDMGREQDSINPDSHRDIMMIAPEGYGHPYYYARTLAIFHVYATILRPQGTANDNAEWQQLFVCFVRWFEVDFDELAPKRPIPLRWATREETPFGFISPDEVLRGCHIVPALAHGRSDDALRGYSACRTDQDTDNKDYNRHIVNQ